jgi:WD40 repeat protein
VGVTALFVSHSSEDAARTGRFRDQLQAEGIQALFVDFDPALGIPAGRNWERELYAQVRKADAVLFLSSPASVASQWCFAEIALARLLDKVAIPIVIAAGATHPLLTGTQHIDATTGEDVSLERLWAALRAAHLDPGASFAWDPARSPYPGLTSFSEDDAAVFFGREPETERLWELVQPSVRGGVIAVVGPSGSGKSSLVRAGLVPRLLRTAERWLVVPRVVPTTQPVRQLARSLAQAFKERGVERAPLELAKRLGEGSGALVELVEELRDTAAGEPPSVLFIVDQAEELITLREPTERRAFLDLLRDAVVGTTGVRVVLTVRAEFLGPLLAEPGTGPLVDETLLVSPLDRSRLPEVIEQPARRAGLQFAPGLVGRLVEDTHGGDALPLLAFTLRQLADRAGADGEIGLDDYDAIGGVVGALRRTADQTMEQLASAGRGDLVLPTLTRLASVTRAAEPTRRRVARQSLTPSEDDVVQAFVDARLLVSGEDQGEAVVEVAHEALLRQWEPLRAAIDARRDELRVRDDIERWVLDWEQSGRDASYLVGGERLTAARAWAALHPEELARSPGANELIAASGEVEARATQERLEAERQHQIAETRGLIQRLRADAEQASALLALDPPRALASALAVTAANLDQLGSPPLAFVQTTLCAAVRTVKEREALAGHAQPVTSVAVDPAGRWIVSAGRDRTVRLWPTADGVAPVVLGEHDGDALCVAVSPDGDLIASGGSDGVVRRWRPDGAVVGPPLDASRDAILCVTLSSDGTIVAGSGDGAVYLWTGPARPARRLAAQSYVAALASAGRDQFAAGCGDGRVVIWLITPGGFEEVTLGHHDDFVTSVGVSPDGQLVASTSRDGTIRLWRVVGGGGPDSQPAVLRPASADRGSLLTSLAFGPDGASLAYGDESGKIELVDLSGRRIHPPLICPGRAVASLALGADGRTMVGGAGAVVHVWDWLPRRPGLATVTTNDPVPRWDVNGDQASPAWLAPEFVAGVAFTPDNQGVVSVGGDRSLRIWGLDGALRTVVPNAHEGALTTVATSGRGGGRIASGGRDNKVRLFDLAGHLLANPFAGHEADVMGVAFRPDGQLIVSGSRDGTVRRWRPDGQPVGSPITAHPDGVEAVAVSPDGTLIASSGPDGTVRLWDADDGASRGTPLSGHVGLVWDVQFSPDGRRVMSCGSDRTVRLWDHNGGTVLGPFRGHTAAVRAGRFHPSGQQMLTAGEDGAIRLWATEDGQLIHRMEGHLGPVFTVAVSSDGLLAATGGEDGTVRLWRLGDWQAWVDEACARLRRHPLLADHADPVAVAARLACPHTP